MIGLQAVGSRTQQFCDFARGNRPAEQIALHFRAAGRTYQGELLFRLGAFRQRGNAEVRSKIGDRPDDRRAIPALAKFGNEGAVDLDLVEGKGARVFHAKFGAGTVATTDGNKLTVDFDKAGRKMVLESFVTAG